MLTLSGGRMQMRPRAGCPKHMVMGPCGGVGHGGGCEVIPEPCVFAAPAVWPEPVSAVPLRRVPLILADYTADPYSVPMLTTVAGLLSAHCDALLVGEHQNRPDFPPTLLASLLQAAGARPWMTLACRDRNRVVLEQELKGLRHLDVEAVLCVTGDARGYDVRPDVTQVFDLDGPRLAALAASVGLPAAVPGAAGAPGAVLNPAATDTVTSFMAAATAAGVTIPVIAAVAVYTDALSAAVLS